MNSETLLEELSLNAWPALRTVHLDGWILRFAGGYSKRANSVNPLYPPAGALALDKKISICERLYRSHSLAPIFKLAAHFYPQELDRTLADRGYSLLAPTSMQTLSLAALTASPVPGIHCSTEPTSRWLATAARIAGIDCSGRRLLGQMLRQIVPATCFMLLQPEEEAVACGYAVAKAGYVGLFQIGTDPRFRRRGYARTVTEQLLRWGKEQGAHTAYLQVTRENEPALRLYQELGFQEQYRYWYRVGQQTK